MRTYQIPLGHGPNNYTYCHYGHRKNLLCEATGVNNYYNCQIIFITVWINEMKKTIIKSP